MWVAVLFVLLVGSRHLITRGVPAIGEMVAFSLSPFDLLRAWASGWRIAGLGSEAHAPTAFGLIGVLGVASAGAMGLLRTVLILGMIPLGALFAYRLPAPTGSRWAQIACLLVYVTVPLPYNALADGRWGALVLYAAAPLVIGMLASASRLAPFGPEGAPEGARVPARSWRGRVLPLGFVTALVAAILPMAVVIVAVMALALALGGVIAMNPKGGLRMIGAGLAGSGIAVLLHLPWSLDFLLPGTTLSSFLGTPRPDQPSDLAALLRFEVGPLGSAPLGWCFLVAAALPLLIARSDRHTWAVRGWTLAVVSFAGAWAAQRGDLPVALPAVDVLLVPAAVGLALATAMGVSAFEVDLPGYRFGWRQIASGVAAAAVLAGILPVLGASFDGRWSMPAGDHARTLAFIDTENDEAPFRVLWLGDPAALPLDGWALDGGLAYATTDAGLAHPREPVGGLRRRRHRAARRSHRPRPHRPDRPPRPPPRPDGRALHRGARAAGPRPLRHRGAPGAARGARHPRGPARPRARRRARRADGVPERGLPARPGRRPGRRRGARRRRASPPPSPSTCRRARRCSPTTNGRVHWSGPIEDDTTVLLSAATPTRWDLTIDGTSVDAIEPFGWGNGLRGGRRRPRPPSGSTPRRSATPSSRPGLGVAVGAADVVRRRLDEPRPDRRRTTHEVRLASPPSSCSAGAIVGGLAHRRRGLADAVRAVVVLAERGGRRGHAGRQARVEPELHLVLRRGDGQRRRAGRPRPADRQPHRRSSSGDHHRAARPRSSRRLPNRRRRGRRPPPRRLPPRPRPPPLPAAPAADRRGAPGAEPDRGRRCRTSSTPRSPAPSSRSTAARSPSSTRSPTPARVRAAAGPPHRAARRPPASGRSRGGSPPGAPGSCWCS